MKFSKARIKSVEVEVAQLCPTLCDPMDYTVHGILQATILELGSYSLLQGVSGDRTQVSHIAGSFFIIWATREAKNTGVFYPAYGCSYRSLSLLQQIFLTQESNQGLLHCRWTLYQLSYQGSWLYVNSCWHFITERLLTWLYKMKDCRESLWPRNWHVMGAYGGKTLKWSAMTSLFWYSHLCRISFLWVQVETVTLF